MNEAELYKLAEQLDEEVSLSDFNTPETDEFDNGEYVDKIENKENSEKPNDKLKSKKKKNKASVDKFKDQYFSYYDDIKIDSHKVTDW